MTTIAEKLTTIKNALIAIKNSIIAKGQTPTGDITTYATAIDNIESGGSSTGIPREVNSSGKLGFPVDNFTFSLPSGITDLVSNCLRCSFFNCLSLTSVDLSSLTTISGDRSLYYAFYDCTSLTELLFPALTSNSFGSYKNQFNYMLSSVTGCTVHFPSNLESVIGSWSDVKSGFGGTNTTVLFDLPATE